MLLKTISVLTVAFASLLPHSADAAEGCSVASHYGIGDGYHGRRTASGERFNAYGHSVAHRWLPFGTRLRVVNPHNGRSVVVRVNDRGPFVGGRSLDLSYGAFSRISNPGRGVARVCYSVV